MLGSVTMGKKLDLSKLTDDEAKHVWDVIQRDFDLRKKEEDRLGDLKTKIEKEDTKRELLHDTNLTESYCIRCLKPFTFLLNNKRQCLDCGLSVCKSCSHYNKKEDGWVCDPCHMTRVLKIGTLEWYHENVRARFKRFGSAKVMRSLFKRLNGEPSGSDIEMRDYDTRSIPEVHTGFEDTSIDQTDGHHYKEMKKPKRRLIVDLLELDLGFDYQSDPRGHHYQTHSPSDSASEMEKRRDKRTEYNNGGLDYSQGAESAFNQQQDEFMFLEGRGPSRSVSRLSYSSCGSGSAGGPRIFLPGPEDSDEDEHFQTFPLYQSHLHSQTSHTSQESLNSNTPQQITDLNKRMKAVESLLNRLEEKVSCTSDQTQTPSSVSPVPQWEVELEEQQLRQKLSEMINNISDHSITDDEEEEEEEHLNQISRPQSSQDIPAWRSPLQGDSFTSKIPTRPSSRLSSAESKTDEKTQQPGDMKTSQSSESLDHKLQSQEERARFRGSTALLFELEDKVAQAAADVQNTQSQVSYIENRIAALNAAGMPVDKIRKSGIPVQARRLSQNFPTTQADRFVRNSRYTGSLTQRNPVKKPQTRATCAVRPPHSAGAN